MTDMAPSNRPQSHEAATGRYVTAYDCGHRVQESSHAPNSASIAQCHVCGRWVGVIVMWRPDRGE